MWDSCNFRRLLEGMDKQPHHEGAPGPTVAGGMVPLAGFCRPTVVVCRAFTDEIQGAKEGATLSEVIEVNVVIAENVRRLREQKSWSQEVLAGAAAISVRTVQRVEKGAGAGPEALLSIASALEVSIDDLRTDPRQELAQLFGVAPHEITPEFITKKTEEAKAKYDIVSLAVVSAAEDLEAIFDIDSMRFQCVSSLEAVRDVAAELEEFLTDLLDVSEVCGPVQRRGYAKAAFEIVQRIQELESVVSIGVDHHRLAVAKSEPVPWRTLYVVVAPSDQAKTGALVERNVSVSFRV